MFCDMNMKYFPNKEAKNLGYILFIMRLTVISSKNCEYHFWMNVPFLDECAIFGGICHFWMNVSFLEECVIFG